MITVDELNKHYHHKPVLKDIQLTLPKGELIAFIGPNGAGKSTLLAIMSRLEKEFSGDLYIDHGEIRSWRSKELAQRLAILKQRNEVQIRITVEELVAFGRFPYSRGRLQEADQLAIEKALAEMALLPLRDQEIQTLSGGQLQRAYIAMILAQDTDYILLDEPLNNLDMNHANQMMHLLRRLVDQLGKTVLLVIHDVNFAAGFAQRIVALKDGAVFRSGRPEEIITPEVLGALYEMDVKVETINGRPFCMYFD